MRVVYHKASDGSLHEDHASFAKHEEKLKIIKAVDDAALNFEDFPADALVIKNFGKFVAANAEALRSILSASVVVKRGRKSKKADKADKADKAVAAVADTDEIGAMLADLEA